MSRANEPANPLTPEHYNHVTQNISGLTIREHFAALFTQAVIAKNPPCGEVHADMSECDKPALYARAGVLYADALLAELAKVRS